MNRFSRQGGAVFFLFFFGMSGHVWAALNLTITASTGGSALRLGHFNGRSEIHHEVRIRITSTDSQQYQVFQRLADPLVNERGMSLPQGTIASYALTGSNSSGTLYLQSSPENLSFSDQMIYASSSGGESDSFIVVYSLPEDAVEGSGNFLGRIAYTVRPMGGGSQDVVSLNVTLDVSEELKINIEGSSMRDSVRLRHGDHAEREEYVKISFSGNLGQRLRIYQEVETFPSNDLAEEIARHAILFATEGDTRGERYAASPVEIERRRVLLYNSDQREDVFFIRFFLDANALEYPKAGFYRGRIKYIVERDGTSQEFPINVEAEIKPIFNLEVNLPPDGIKFQNLFPDASPEIKAAEVFVESNLGRPYMVMQKVVTPLTNERGDRIASEFFTLKGEHGDHAAGKISFQDFHPVPEGETPIYFSDSKGSSSRFKMLYRLQAYPKIAPGDYSTVIIYSLGEK